MFLTRQELEDRLKNQKNLFNENSSFAVVRPNKPGTKTGSHSTRDIETQSTIGALAKVAPREVVAEIFDKSTRQISRIANADPDGDGESDDALLKEINRKLGTVTDTAIATLQQSLGLISKEKLANSKARELSSIAKDMAVIVDKARPVAKDSNSSKPQIIFYAPRFHKEEHYDVVEVK